MAVPITQHRLQEMIRDLADYTGLDPRVPGKIIYRIRPAEIGRDFFRTLCENAGVPESISEYLLGHKVDPLDYNKFHRTDEGKARIEEELQKVRPLLNVISGTGKPTVNPDLPYLDKLKSTAEEHGLTPEELVASLIPFAKRLPVFGEIKKKL